MAGFSPIIAFADPQQPDFDGLREVCASGEHFYCDSWQGAPPPGWQIDVESSMFRMVWDGPQPAQGRGLASALIHKLLRGDTPFLQVMHDNPVHQLYQRMGFRYFRHTVVRVLSKRSQRRDRTK